MIVNGKNPYLRKTLMRQEDEIYSRMQTGNDRYLIHETIIGSFYYPQTKKRDSVSIFALSALHFKRHTIRGNKEASTWCAKAPTHQPPIDSF